MRRRLATVLLLALAACCLAPSVALAKSTPRLTISASSAWEHFDKKPVISGRLTSATGRPLAKATVKLYSGTKYVASKKTDSRGRVSFSASLPGSEMSGSWRLQYAGSRVYRSVWSARKYTRIHVHFSGPAGVVGELGEDTGDTVDDGTDDGTDDTTDESSPDDGIESGLDDGSPYAAGFAASTVLSDEETTGPADDEQLDDVSDGTEGDAGEEPVAAEFNFIVNVFLDKGHRYAIEVGEPSRIRITDSAETELKSTDGFDDVVHFTAPASDDYTLRFDAGLTLEELDELFVLVW